MLGEFETAKKAFALKARCDELGLEIDFSSNPIVVWLGVRRNGKFVSLGRADSLAEAVAFVEGYRMRPLGEAGK